MVSSFILVETYDKVVNLLTNIYLKFLYFQSPLCNINKLHRTKMILFNDNSRNQFSVSIITAMRSWI